MTQFKGCLKGSSDPVQAKRIIEFLTRLGGVNHRSHDGSGVGFYYYIIDGHIERIGANCVPDNYTLTSLQPDVLLPVSWCVKIPCNHVRKYLDGRISSSCWSRFIFFGETDGLSSAKYESWGIELSESQFLALTAPENPAKGLHAALTGKEEREIEGYVCPMDMDSGQLKQGSLFVKEGKFFYKNDQGYRLFKELVEKYFKPKYKEVRRPLFTTEDGVDVFEEKLLFAVSVLNWHLWEGPYSISIPNIKLFSTRSAAENYIVENKPVLSYKDVIGLLITSKEVEDLAPELKQLIQSKIKG